MRKMGDKNMKKAILVAVVVMGLFILGQGMEPGRFERCYKNCYPPCVAEAKKKIPNVPKKYMPCAWDCTKRCAPGEDLPWVNYCTIACSVDLCTDIYDDPAKMEPCVVTGCSGHLCRYRKE